MPPRPRPSRSADTNSSSVHEPIPAFGSGVMFGATRVPNGVCNVTPPAYGLPPGLVWQAAQSAAMARYRPRSTVLERLQVPARGAA